MLLGFRSYAYLNWTREPENLNVIPCNSFLQADSNGLEGRFLYRKIQSGRKEWVVAVVDALQFVCTETLTGKLSKYWLMN